LKKRFMKLRDVGGDPGLTILLQYKQYKKQDGAKGNGNLLAFTVKASDLLIAEENGSNLCQSDLEHGGASESKGV